MTTVELATDPQAHASPGVVRRPRSSWRSPALLLALAVIALVALAALLPGALTRQDPLVIHLDQSFAAPSAEHWFGTDQSGRDVFARVVHGTRQSVLIGLGATALAMAGALVLGLLAGLGSRFTDGAVNRAVEVLYAFPGLLLALVLITVFGNGALTQIVAVGVASLPGYTRMVRGQVLAVRFAPYVQAARTLGHPSRTVVARTILPNAFRPLVALITLGVGQAIVWAAALGFLGLGVQPPAPEWGAMLNAGRNYLQQAWWLDFFPGAVIILTTLAVTVLGRFLQNATRPGSPS